MTAHVRLDLRDGSTSEWINPDYVTSVSVSYV